MVFAVVGASFWELALPVVITLAAASVGVIVGLRIGVALTAAGLATTVAGLVLAVVLPCDSGLYMDPPMCEEEWAEQLFGGALVAVGVGMLALVVGLVAVGVGRLVAPVGSRQPDAPAWRRRSRPTRARRLSALVVLAVCAVVAIGAIAFASRSKPRRVQTAPTPASVVVPNCGRLRSGEKTLVGIDGVGCDLPDANLAGADLTRANLVGANLAGADLSGANLAGADLSGANLTGAKLHGVNLAGASLFAAYLSDSDLTGANLTGAALTGVTWSNSTCPDGTDSATNSTSPESCIGHGGGT